MVDKLRIKLNVPYETAIRKGSTQSGYFVLEPTDAEMQSLTPEEREIFAQVPTSSEGGFIYVWLHKFGTSDVADFSAVRPLLVAAKANFDADRARDEARQAEERAKKEAERAEKMGRVQALVDQVRTNVRAVVFETSWGSASVGATAASLVRWSELSGYLSPEDQDVIALLEAEQERRKAETQRLQEETKAREEAEERAARVRDREFLAKHGTPEQVERFDAGYLDGDELLAVVRDTLFRPFEDFPRYEKLVKDDVEHDDECYEGKVVFRVEEKSTLNPAQYFMLKQMRKICEHEGLLATVQPFYHTATCNECNSSTETRDSIKITLIWNGRKLSREYAL